LFIITAGGLQAKAKLQFVEIAAVCPDFGTKPNQARLAPDTHKRIALCKELRPFEDLHDCQIVSGFGFTSQLGFRDRKELDYALWKEIECTFEVGGPYDGLRKIIWHPGWDKSNQLYLERTPTRSSNTERVFYAVEDPDNPQCGVRATHQLRRGSPPGQIRLLCREAKKTLTAEYKRNGVPYRTNPKRLMGVNSTTKFTVELCEHSGIEKPKHGKHSN
jgi:hypothetical protein